MDGLCTKSEECHVSDTDPTKNEQVECVAGRCQCKMGYHIATDGVTCTGDREKRRLDERKGVLKTYEI
ncbi:hypothetical protein B566_EDAN013214 [Ephemera danica]|nr:hypothetical protein B566_EDAN013214 [Ephemera danica]